MNELVTSASIAAAFAAILSVALAFFPKIKDAFAAIPDDDKRKVVFGLCLAIAVGLVALACAGVDTGSGAVCPTTFSVAVVYAFLTNVLVASGAAQVTFTLVVRPIKKAAFKG